MRIEKNKILVYDDNCPLCSWYSNLFVRHGFIPKEGRIAFSSLDASFFSIIDVNKGRNEIPLVDLSSGKVLYGIDSLLEILGQKYPWIKRAGNTRPLKWFLKKLYKFISYNRKVIVAKKCGDGKFDCAPDMNYRYRGLFMFLFLIFNTLALFPLQELVLTKLSFYHLSIQTLQAAHFGLVLSNFILAFTFHKQKAYEYLGQVNMLALTAILLLIPLLPLQLIGIGEGFIIAYLILTTIIVFKEYLRRMEYAGILIRYKWVVSINLLCLCGFILFLFG